MVKDSWLEHLPVQSRPLAEGVPASIRRYVDAEVGALLTPDIIARFTPDMADWSAEQVWRSMFTPTALDSIRMEANVGKVCSITSDRHPRYPYFTYVPMKLQLNGAKQAPLIVTIHGSERNAYASRDRFAEFAEEHGCFVLAPMFPMDLNDSDPDEQYKYVFTPKVRFDLVVFDLIEDFSRVIGTTFGPLLFHGYSGGGQFVNRFLYLHADRVAAASIGAPGYVTLPDANVEWRTGIGGLEALTGRRPDLAALAKVPLHLMIGDQDNGDIDNYSREELGLSAEDYEKYGRNRIQRLERLRDDYRALGADVTYDLVPGMAHGTRVEPALKFFERFLSGGFGG